MMKRVLLKSKIHRATVTEANLEYNGSVTIDRELMDGADLQYYIGDSTDDLRYYR